MAKKSKRPCERVKRGLRACFWHSVDVCACYQPGIREELSGKRYPKFTSIELVPVDFCEAHYIPIKGPDQHFQRNVTLLSYREVTKQMERDAEISGSAAEKKEGLTLF